MAYQPIENYGMIGNLRTVALVGVNGSIDWFCYPEFSSPSIFGAILDDQKGGRFVITPVASEIRNRQLYWPSTNILVTRFLLADGIGELEDFMPAGLSLYSPWFGHLYRRVRCVRGSIRFKVKCNPAFDYGRKRHETIIQSNGAIFVTSALRMALSSPVTLRHGELLDTYYLYNKYVSPISYNFWRQIRERLDWICENWKLPDEGVWEMRNRKESFVFSNVMNWVALDRGIRLSDKRSFPANRERWLLERDAIYEEVMNKGWSSNRNAFTQFSGSNDLDASMLILPLVFFMAPNDPRMLSTIDAILESPRNGGLVSGGLVYRYTPQGAIDGLSGQEGTFNMCSFWLVEALTRAGRVDPDRLRQAQLLFERMLGFANHQGLYAEQTGPQGEALGNFPQAFTHLALISAVFNLDKVLDGR